jgi:N-acetylglucosaminyl-diphospho-decaprenol L-rhamnosyltransferase
VDRNIPAARRPPVDLSIIIVNFRAYPALRRCLTAIVETVAEISAEIIVADNDPAPEALREIEIAFPSVTILPMPKNVGYGGAVNRAAALVAGRYMLLLNPDVTLGPGLCDLLVRHADAHPETGAVGPRIVDPSQTVQGSARRFPEASTLLFGRRSWLTRQFPNNRWSRRNILVSPSPQGASRVDWVSGACVLTPTGAFQEVGGFDERFFLYWEDADLCKRLAQRGRTVWYLPQAEVIHIGGVSTRQTRWRAIVAFHCSAFRYARKHVRGVRRFLFLPLAGFVVVRAVAEMLGVTREKLHGSRRGFRWRDPPEGRDHTCSP